MNKGREGIERTMRLKLTAETWQLIEELSTWMEIRDTSLIHLAVRKGLQVLQKENGDANG